MPNARSTAAYRATGRHHCRTSLRSCGLADHQRSTGSPTTIVAIEGMIEGPSSRHNQNAAPLRPASKQNAISQAARVCVTAECTARNVDAMNSNASDAAHPSRRTDVFATPKLIGFSANTA